MVLARAEVTVVSYCITSVSRYMTHINSCVTISTCAFPVHSCITIKLPKVSHWNAIINSNLGFDYKLCSLYINTMYEFVCGCCCWHFDVYSL